MIIRLVPYKINTSPTLISFAPSLRTILARYPSSIHSISTVALSYPCKLMHYQLCNMNQTLSKESIIKRKRRNPYCFNFTKYFTRYNLITLFLQPPCYITLHFIEIMSFEERKLYALSGMLSRALEKGVHASVIVGEREGIPISWCGGRPVRIYTGIAKKSCTSKHEQGELVQMNID